MGDIHYKVREYINDGHPQHITLDGGIIPVRYGRYDHAPDTFPVVDGFNDRRAAEQSAKGKPKHIDDGDHGAGKHMMCDDRPFAYAS